MRVLSRVSTGIGRERIDNRQESHHSKRMKERRELCTREKKGEGIALLMYLQAKEMKKPRRDENPTQVTSAANRDRYETRMDGPPWFIQCIPIRVQTLSRDSDLAKVQHVRVAACK